MKLSDEKISFVIVEMREHGLSLAIIIKTSAARRDGHVEWMYITNSPSGPLA